MALNIGTEETPNEVFLQESGGFIDALVRASNAETFEAAAKAVDLYYELTEIVTDPNTGEETEQGTGEWVLSPGVYVDPIGAVVLIPGTYDDEGNELTAPTLDTRYHVNIRLSSPALENTDENGELKWHKWATQWTQTGTVDPQVNASEQARILMGVSLIDPDSIVSHTRVWL